MSELFVCNMSTWGTINTRAPFYSHGLTLIPAWINNHIHYKVWDEITYPFLNFDGANYLSIPKLRSLGMDKYFHPTLYNGCDYLPVLGLKLNHVGKRGPRGPFYQQRWAKPALRVGHVWVIISWKTVRCNFSSKSLFQLQFNWIPFKLRRGWVTTFHKSWT